MDDERDARYGSGWSQNDPAAERPPWLRQLLRSRRPSQPPVGQNGALPSGRYPATGPFTPPGRLPGAPSSGVLGRAPSSANLGRRRDIAAEQTAMMDIARTDLVQCPRCGAANYDNASRCAECGYVLLISCPRCGLVNRTGTMQCARCGLFLSQPTGAPRTGAYGVAAPVSRPLPSLADALSRAPVESSPQRPIGRWLLTTLVGLTLICAFIVALAEGFPPVNDAIASVTHIDIHAAITSFVDFLLGLLPH
jgi:Double zinc ribbon